MNITPLFGKAIIKLDTVKPVIYSWYRECEGSPS